MKGKLHGGKGGGWESHNQRRAVKTFILIRTLACLNPGLRLAKSAALGKVAETRALKVLTYIHCQNDQPKGNDLRRAREITQSVHPWETNERMVVQPFLLFFSPKPSGRGTARFRRQLAKTTQYVPNAAPPLPPVGAPLVGALLRTSQKNGCSPCSSAPSADKKVLPSFVVKSHSSCGQDAKPTWHLATRNQGAIDPTSVDFKSDHELTYRSKVNETP